MLHEGLRVEESIIFLGELGELLVSLQHFLLSVMELFKGRKNSLVEIVNRYYLGSICLVRSMNACVAGGTLVSLWSRKVKKKKKKPRIRTHFAIPGKTFVLLGIIGLESDLQFNALYKVALLFVIASASSSYIEPRMLDTERLLELRHAVSGCLSSGKHNQLT